MWKWLATKQATWGEALVLLAIGGLATYFAPKIGIFVLLVLFFVGLYLIWRAYKEEKRKTENFDDWYKKVSGDNPQDKSWSMAALDQYPIAPEVLPVVLKVWKSRTAKGSDFTIREAKWIPRLSAQLTDIDRLSYKAWQYARTELMFELIERPFDSTVLDKLLLGLPAGIGNFIDFLSILSEQREDQEKGIKDGVEQIRELTKGKSKKLHRRITGTAGIAEVLDRKKETK